MSNPKSLHSIPASRAFFQAAISAGFVALLIGLRPKQHFNCFRTQLRHHFLWRIRLKSCRREVGKQVAVNPEYMLDQDRYAAQKSTTIPLAIGTSFGVLRRITNISTDTQVLGDISPRNDQSERPSEQTNGGSKPNCRYRRVVSF